MVQIPNPMNNPMDLSIIFNISSDELLKVAVIGMIFMGFFICWFTRKIQKLNKKSDDLGRYRFK